MPSTEARIIKCYFSRLVNSIVNPGQLADALYSAGLIDKSTRLDAALPSENTLDKASKLLSAVERNIAVSPGNFQQFLSVLKEQLTTEALLDQIEQQYQRERAKAPPTPPDEPSSTVRARRPPIPNTSSNITDEYDDAEISCWPAVKGVGTVIIVSLLIWSFLMFVYTAPSASQQKNQERVPLHHVPSASNECHKLSNPSIAFEELQMEISDAKTLGIYLGLPMVQVDIIERENRSEREKLVTVLHTCHDYDTCPCWEDIVNALIQYGNTRKAKEIENKYIIDNNED